MRFLVCGCDNVSYVMIDIYFSLLTSQVMVEPNGLMMTHRAVSCATCPNPVTFVLGQDTVTIRCRACGCIDLSYGSSIQVSASWEVRLLYWCMINSYALHI